MARVVNTIDNKIRTTGGKRAAEGINQVTKAQTRLGQSAASAGRQFSAQASGLGGLVSAYAGAAATVFALQQAFSALNRAARAEQTIAGVNALATAVGESGTKVLESIQRITKGQLSIVDAAEQANLALSSGFSATQIENLSAIALKASRALGRDLGDSFNRLVRGVTKLEPELLDELGIFVRIEPAAAAYAASIGKVASQLSAFEKRQAFANAVAKEGTEKFQDIDTSGETAAQSLEQLVATLTDLGISVGGFIANAIQPLVQALGQPGAVIGTFGILIKTIFGTALREANGAVTRFAEGFNRVADSAGNALQSTGALSKANETLAETTNKVNLGQARTTQGNKKQFGELIKLTREQKASQSQIASLNKIAKQELATTTQSIALINAKTNVNKRDTAQLTILTARQTQFNNVLQATNARLLTQGVVARSARRGIIALGKAIGFVGKAFTGFLGVLSTVITVLSIVSVVGAAILEAFGWLEPVTKQFEQLIRTVQNFLNITKEARGIKNVRAELEGILPGPITETKTVGTGTFKATARGVRREITKDVTTTRDPAATAVLNIAKATGQSFLATANSLKFINAEKVKLNTSEKLSGDLAKRTAQFIDVSKVSDLKRLEVLKKFNETQTDIIQSQIVSVKLADLLKAGTGTIEAIEKRRAAIRGKINSLEAKAADMNMAEAAQNDKTIAALEQQLVIQSRLAEQQLVVLRANDRLRKTFASQIKAADQLSKFFTVIKNENKTTIELNDTAKKQQQSQTIQLQKQFELGKKFLKTRQEGGKLEGTQVALANLAATAQQALVGSLLKALEAGNALARSVKKRLKTEQDAVKVLEQQLALRKAQQKIDDTKRAAAEKEAEFNSLLKILKANDSLAKAEQKLIDIRRKGRRDALENIIAGDPLLSKGEKMSLKLKLDGADLKALKENAEAQRRSIIAQEKIEEKKLKAQKVAAEALLEAEGVRIVEEARQLKIRREIRKEDAIRQINLQEEDNKLIMIQLEGFKGHVSGMAAVLAADLTERQKLDVSNQKAGTFEKGVSARFQSLLSGATGAEESKLKELFRTVAPTVGPGGQLSSDQASNLNTQLNRRDIAPGLKERINSLVEELKPNKMIFGRIRTEIKKRAEAQKELDDAIIQGKASQVINASNEKVKAINTSLEVLFINTGAQLQGVAASTLQAELALKNYSKQVDDANDIFLQAGNQIKSTIQSSLVSGFQELNQAFIDGTLTISNLKDGFRSFAEQLIKSIQQIFFTETIAKPAASGLMKMLGLGSSTGSIVSAGLPPTDMAGLAGAASGGRVDLAGAFNRLAAGGSPRDRVPSLLEPGEFVMQRKAVKAAGLPAMQQMNSGGMLPISVNISNEGTPQEATSATPNIDVDKIVIDVVTRDLRNNGPIRKSLRGGA